MRMKTNQIRVNLHKEDGLWQRCDFDIKKIIKITILKVFEFISVLEPEKKYEVSVKLSNDKELQSLNKKFMGKDRPTNVLSFPFLNFKEGSLERKGEVEVYLGDIAISYERIYNESKEQNKTFRNHFIHLIIHSLLHLLGYDHKTKKQAVKMESLEIKILNSLKINNPYA